ncbi:hypothetical protein LPJ66_011088 [Kickxella alabastrina]|uniref:Uncharacterized protein n=1 Tax=Kickxella alabastrina TaxID=61397 RepID=A0ACC1I0X2_9FUNG|nr:hypothetical protein LPJ66_011088 [Kickxella alabastrina]
MKSEHFGDSDYGNGKQMEQRAKFLSELWQQSEEAAALQRRINSPELTPISETQFRRTSPPMVQLRYLLKRTWLNTSRKKLVLKLRIAQSIYFGLLIRLVCLNSQDRILEWRLHNFSGGMFFNCVAQFLMSSLGVVNVFAHERKVFLRERQGKYYGLPAYYAAKIIVEQPINIATAMVYSAVSCWLSELERTLAKFLVYMVSMVVVAFNGYSIGVLLGAMFRDITAIVTVLPILFLPIVLYGGLFFVGYISVLSVGDKFIEKLRLNSLSITTNTLINIWLALSVCTLSYLMLMLLTIKTGGTLGRVSNRAQREKLLAAPDPRFTVLETACLVYSQASPTPSSAPPTPERGWRKHLHAFKDRPASHITTFAVLHEITAIAPLFSVYYALDYFEPKVPVPQAVLEEGNRYVNRLRQYVGWEALATDSPVLLHLATSYAVVKAAAPLRIAASLAMTPWVARWCTVPVVRGIGKARAAVCRVKNKE